jgi:hypothetical protein
MKASYHLLNVSKTTVNIGYCLMIYIYIYIYIYMGQKGYIK